MSSVSDVKSSQRDKSNLPILITIGPQCAGKTTTLLAIKSRLKSTELKDIAIDDHPLVYHKLPTEYFLSKKSKHVVDEEKMIGERKLKNRICDYTVTGQILVAKRLENVISRESFAELWPKSMQKYIYPHKEIDRIWIEEVEKAVENGVRLTTKMIDLFLPDFHYPNGVLDTNRKLEQTSEKHDGPIAWGNTNVKSKDFAEALYIAMIHNRPVKFIRWGKEIPEVPLNELFQRNLVRFASTGRYIPPQAISLTLYRVNLLYSRTNRGSSEMLAYAAGFKMSEEGKVLGLVERGPGEALKIERALREQLPALKFQKWDTWTEERSSFANGGAISLPFPYRSDENQWIRQIFGEAAAESVTAFLEKLRNVSRLAESIAERLERKTNSDHLSEVVRHIFLVGDWEKRRSWRQSAYTEKDLNLKRPFFVEKDETDESSEKIKKTGDNYRELDTLDLVRIINGDKNSKYKF